MRSPLTKTTKGLFSQIDVQLNELTTNGIGEGSETFGVEDDGCEDCKAEQKQNGLPVHHPHTRRQRFIPYPVSAGKPPALAKKLFSSRKTPDGNRCSKEVEIQATRLH